MIAPWSASVEAESEIAISPVAVVMAADRSMFEQLQRSIESIRANCRYSYDLCVLALDLTVGQQRWLDEQGARVFTDLDAVPCFPDAPRSAVAMTCRPYLRELLPGYDVYFWIDADIRLTDEAAADFYVQSALRHPLRIAIAQETDPTYTFVGHPETVRKHHSEKHERFASTYGGAVAEEVRYFTPFNAGIFALHRDSPVWDRYRQNLELSMTTGFDHLKEQDALNLAILQSPEGATVAPPTMNWLCSVSLPKLSEPSGRWVRPAFPFEPISVLHLTNSNGPMELFGEQLSRYEFYLYLGLPA